MAAPIRVEHSETIDRPVDVVFAALIDVAAYPQWQAGVVATRLLDEGPLRVGSRVVEVREFMGRKLEGTVEITDLAPDRRFGFRCGEGSIPFQGAYVCTPTASGTRIDVEMDLTPTGLLSMARAFLPSMFGKQLSGNFQELKLRLEGATGSTASSP